MSKTVDADTFKHCRAFSSPPQTERVFAQKVDKLLIEAISLTSDDMGRLLLIIMSSIIFCNSGAPPETPQDPHRRLLQQAKVPQLGRGNPCPSGSSHGAFPRGIDGGHFGDAPAFNLSDLSHALSAAMNSPSEIQDVSNVGKMYNVQFDE